MRVLVTGAQGFIGSIVVAHLLAAGHEVVPAVRRARPAQGGGLLAGVACDMALDVDEGDWLPRLGGINAVVNCAGILRERGRDRFEAVHTHAPLALFRDCASAGVRRVVQVSALGDPADGEFIASKHRADAALLDLDLDAVVLRPSVVYDTRGSHGGTSLLRAMAALPYVLCLPGTGRQCLQPVAAEGLARIVVAAVERTQPVGMFEIVGPVRLTLAGYLRAWRDWLGAPAAREVHVPRALVRIIARIGETFGAGPLGLTMHAMLERGNVGAPGAWERQRARFGIATRDLAEVLASAPAQAQDRWHARLYFVLPMLRTLMAVLWIGSGLLGLLLPDAVVHAVTPDGRLSAASAVLLARASGAVDLALGLLCLLRWRPRVVLGSMLLMLVAYTLGIGVPWPQHWLDPFGGLAKNVPLAAALLVLLATESRR
jgi:uncharacterized protein YbjT (DUF2867 family)